MFKLIFKKFEQIYSKKFYEIDNFGPYYKIFKKEIYNRNVIGQYYKIRS